MSIAKLTEEANRVQEYYKKDCEKVENFIKNVVKDKTMEGTKISVYVSYSLGNDYEVKIHFKNTLFFSDFNILTLTISVKGNKVEFGLNYPSSCPRTDVPHEDALACLNSITASGLVITKAIKVNSEIYTDMFLNNYTLKEKQSTSLKAIEIQESQNALNDFNSKLVIVNKVFTIANNQEVKNLIDLVFDTKLKYDSFGDAIPFNYKLIQLNRYRELLMYNNLRITVDETANGSKVYKLNYDRISKANLEKKLRELNIIKIDDVYPKTCQEMLELTNVSLPDSMNQLHDLQFDINKILKLIE